jgi:hypothetical protein
MVSARWTAVVCLTADDFFANALRGYFDKTAIGWTMTKVANPSIIVDPKSVPVYQLLGDLSAMADDSRLAVLRSEYLRKRRQWPKLLRSFPDFAKGDPLFFAGTSSIVPLVCDFLNELLSLGAVVPRRLIFLSEDPTAVSPQLLGLVRDFCQIDTINCSLAEFCEAASPLKLNERARPEMEDGSLVFDLTKLYGVEDQVAFVPSQLSVSSINEQKHRLLDILFSPTNVDWSPYAAGLDFQRDLARDVEKTIKERFESISTISKSCILIKGEAGAGKTVLMRRVAFDMGTNGNLCIWIRPGHGVASGTKFDAVVKAIDNAVHGRKTRVVLFFDDPSGSRRTSREILTALMHAKFPWVLVFGVRNSDFAQTEDQSFYLSKCEAFEVPTDLTPNEMARLPDYLVSLDAAKSPAEAASLVKSLVFRDEQGNLFPSTLNPLYQDGKDILCMLWYLLPQTRAAISGSLTNEYLRLGGIGGAIKQYAEASFDQLGIARTAYELVTTTSGLGTPLPVEVLVATLGIPYGDWLNMCSEKKPLWGLLYNEPCPAANTFGFRTRNHVVTKILLSLLNGGSPGHAGEFRCLKRLITACNSSAPQYREFLCDILVTRKRALESKLTYEQGLELFDLAVGSFPLPDRTISHHRALWIKDVGRLPLEAYKALEDVQRIAEYPHATRPEPLEHIHTSMAACALQAVSQGNIELRPGVELVRQHVAKASTPNFFDLYSEHLNARVLIKMASHVRNEDPEQFITCLEEATRIIDRAFLIIDPLPEYRLEVTGASRLFSELRAEVTIAFADLEQANVAAFALFKEKKNQMGFVLAFRLLVGTAKEKDKGSLFKKAQDFLNKAIFTIEESGLKPIADLYLCRAELMIVWRILPRKGDVNWECVKNDLKIAVGAPHFSRDPIWLFYLAVAHYHLLEIPMAEALFSGLRQLTMSSMLRSPFRCFFMGSDGMPRTFQGKLESGASRNRYIQCGDLDADVMARKGDFSQPDHATVHFRIAFSLLGPLAVLHNISDIRTLER